MLVRSLRTRRALLNLAFALAILSFHVGVARASEEDPFGNVEADTDRWIELRSRIATTTSQWSNEKALLESTTRLLETEQTTLRDNLESNRAASDIMVNNRDRMAALLAEHRDGLDSLDEPLRAIEASIRSLEHRLPDPLRLEIRSSLARLEAAASDSENGQTAIATRAQSVVAILTAIDRFSNSLTVTRQPQPSPDGGEVSVRVLYWGLAAAYGLDEANQRAWIIGPGSDGWVWEERNEAFDTIANLIASYESDVQDPELVLVPARLD